MADIKKILMGTAVSVGAIFVGSAVIAGIIDSFKDDNEKTTIIENSSIFENISSPVSEPESFSSINSNDENTDSNSIDNSSSVNVEDNSVDIIQIDSSELNGRGIADNGREEPNYIGTSGYAVVSYSEEHVLKETDNFSDKLLWEIPTYEKDKQFWNTAKYTLSHKTEVVVIEQFLEHKGYGSYSGYLLVEETNNGKQVYIDVSNYITKPYWSYTSDLVTAAKIGYFVAEFNQKSDFYPVDRSGNKVTLENGTIVLAVGSKAYNSENGIEAIVWKEWKNGYGIEVSFNEDDLSIMF